jgi:hypothetical protein
MPEFRSDSIAYGRAEDDATAFPVKLSPAPPPPVAILFPSAAALTSMAASTSFPSMSALRDPFES